MKNLLLIITLFCCQIGYAQDAIVFKNGDSLNCKIYSVDKEYILFVKNNDPSKLVKKAPLHFVSFYKFNHSVVDNTSSERIVQNADTTEYPLQGLSFDTLNVSNTNYLIEAGKRQRRILNVQIISISILSSLVLVGSLTSEPAFAYIAGLGFVISSTYIITQKYRFGNDLINAGKQMSVK